MIANNNTLFAILTSHATCTEASVLPNSTDSLPLQLVQVPISPDFAIFVSTTMTTKTTELIVLPGNNSCQYTWHGFVAAVVVMLVVHYGPADPQDVD